MTEKTLAAGLYRPEIWSKELLRVLDDEGVMVDCVNRNYEGEIKNQGDTVHIQKPGDITVSAYTPNAEDFAGITYQAVGGKTDSLVVDQAQYWAFKLPTIDKKQANITLDDKYLARAKKAIGLKKDTYLLTKGIQGVAAGNQLGAKTITPSTVYKTFIEMFEKLARANAINAAGKGEDGKRPFLVLPPEIISVVKLSPEATHATTMGDDVIRKGAIMTYAGFDIKQATNLKVSSSTYTILGGTKEGITYADQITEVETLKHPNEFGDFLRGLYVYGALAAQPECLTSAVITIGA